MTYLISDADSFTTVREFLLSKGCSQALLRKLKNAPKGIALCGKEVHANHVLVPGDVLFITLPEEKRNEKIKPCPMPLLVVWEDDHILVINKRAGVPVHPSQGYHENTLAHGLAHPGSWIFSIQSQRSPSILRRPFRKI